MKVVAAKHDVNSRQWHMKEARRLMREGHATVGELAFNLDALRTDEIIKLCADLQARERPVESGANN
ncbi:MAG: hypothetical protein EOM24_00905 [Chloroflexia bacterium]|nr:hypothetical protein [Chloroflexia bacterium]